MANTEREVQQLEKQLGTPLNVDVGEIENEGEFQLGGGLDSCDSESDFGEHGNSTSKNLGASTSFEASFELHGQGGLELVLQWILKGGGSDSDSGEHGNSTHKNLGASTSFEASFELHGQGGTGISTPMNIERGGAHLVIWLSWIILQVQIVLPVTILALQ